MQVTVVGSLRTGTCITQVARARLRWYMRIIAEALLQELNREVPASRLVLERIPFDQFEWQPHPRSMSAAQLALHVASIPGNVARLAISDGFDVATAPSSYPSPQGPPS